MSLFTRILRQHRAAAQGADRHGGHSLTGFAEVHAALGQLVGSEVSVEFPGDSTYHRSRGTLVCDGAVDLIAGAPGSVCVEFAVGVDRRASFSLTERRVLGGRVFGNEAERAVEIYLDGASNLVVRRVGAASRGARPSWSVRWSEKEAS